MIITAIVAVDRNWGIGYKGKLPWPHNARDMKHFKQYTDGKVLVMGGRTYKEVGELPNRHICVVYRNIDQSIGPLVLFCAQHNQSELIIAGGAHVYEQAAPYCNRIVLTQFDAEYEADKFLPEELRATDPTQMHKWQLASAVFHKADNDDPAMTIAVFNRVPKS